MEQPLYHYTSLETLALILTNKTLAFNSLLNVDDIEEAQSMDMGNFGKYVYVSCWTDKKEESIAMWNLYTPNMHGVRIALPRFPFKVHHYIAGQFFLKSDIDTFINLEAMYNENKGATTVNYPELFSVIYTNDDDLIFPKIRTGNPQHIDKFLALSNLSEITEPLETGYTFKDLGRYKKQIWAFQKEWRYILFISPMSLQEANPPTLEKQQEFIRRLEDVNRPAPYQRFLIELDDDALRQMEVIFGPRMTEAEKILASALLDKHGLSGHYRESQLKIR